MCQLHLTTPTVAPAFSLQYITYLDSVCHTAHQNMACDADRVGIRYTFLTTEQLCKVTTTFSVILQEMDSLSGSIVIGQRIMSLNQKWQIQIRHREEILHLQGGEALEQVTQRSCGYPNPGSIYGQVGWGNFGFFYFLSIYAWILLNYPAWWVKRVGREDLTHANDATAQGSCLC